MMAGVHPMSSLLVFAKPDNIHPDPTQDWRKFKRGDVIDVNDDDNFFWGTDIQGKDALGWWRIVVLPGVPASQVLSMLFGDNMDPLNPDQPIRLRINQVNLDGLEQGQVLKTTDQVTTDFNSFIALRTSKPPLPKVGVDGQPAVVIG